MQADDQTRIGVTPAVPVPPPSFWRTLRFGTRASWDALGFTCAMSLTIFVAMLLPAGAALRMGRLLPLAIALCALLWALLVAPLYAGACTLAHRILTHDSPSFSDLWAGSRSLYSRAAALGALHLLVTVILVANVAFYLSRGGIVWMLLAVAFLYLLIFWAVNVVYHMPLLVAADLGVIPREREGGARVSSALRNGFLLAMSAPGYSFLLALMLIVLGIPAAISGVGMALIFPGYAAILTTRATRDQLTRFGILPPEPDPDVPVADEGWRNLAEEEKRRRGEGEKE